MLLQAIAAPVNAKIGTKEKNSITPVIDPIKLPTSVISGWPIAKASVPPQIKGAQTSNHSDICGARFGKPNEANRAFNRTPVKP